MKGRARALRANAAMFVKLRSQAENALHNLENYAPATGPDRRDRHLGFQRHRARDRASAEMRAAQDADHGSTRLPGNRTRYRRGRNRRRHRRLGRMLGPHGFGRLCRDRREAAGAAADRPGFARHRRVASQNAPHPHGTFRRHAAGSDCRRGYRAVGYRGQARRRTRVPPAGRHVAPAHRSLCLFDQLDRRQGGGGGNRGRHRARFQDDQGEDRRAGCARPGAHRAIGEGRERTRRVVRRFQLGLYGRRGDRSRGRLARQRLSLVRRTDRAGRYRRLSPFALARLLPDGRRAKAISPCGRRAIWSPNASSI